MITAAEVVSVAESKMHYLGVTNAEIMGATQVSTIKLDATQSDGWGTVLLVYGDGMIKFNLKGPNNTPASDVIYGGSISVPMTVSGTTVTLTVVPHNHYIIIASFGIHLTAH